MELYIGGYAQGKLAYVRKIIGEDNGYIVRDAESIEGYGLRDVIIFYRFHEWFLHKLEAGEEPEDIMDRILMRYGGLIIICNEVGNGIVPMEAAEREYRERLGRYLCLLAQRAERVERVLCGIGQRIK